MEESKYESEVRLYRWPFGLRQRFVTMGGMLVRLFLYVAGLSIVFILGYLWGSLRDPHSSDISQDQRSERVEQDALHQCCLKDIRAAQEALTKLSADAQRLGFRLKGLAKDAARPQLLSSVAFVEEHARGLWDRLESLLQDSSERRRKLRDIRIDLEGMKEQFQVAEMCCGPAPHEVPKLKHYLHTAELRFQVVQARVSPEYIEGEITVLDATHETGHSYLVKQNFDTAGDTSKAPTASTLKIYEDGIALGPAHSGHADIRKFGRGRYSHWEDALYFSSSDNSDPRTNKRRYTYRSYSSVPTDSKATSTPTSMPYR
jgi:hypothetical protein